MISRSLLAGVLASLALTPAMHAQVPARPKPQRPIEVPPAVVVLQIDTTAGDSTRTIIQRDFDYGDRMQPLILDSVTMADIWRPGSRRINFDPIAQTRANFIVRGLPTATGLHVEVYDPKGKLRQEAYFRLPRVPANRLTAIKDSLAAILEARRKTTYASLAADSVKRDSLARESTRPVPLKHPGQRVAAKNSAAARDSLSRESWTARTPFCALRLPATRCGSIQCTRESHSGIRHCVTRSAVSGDSRSMV